MSCPFLNYIVRLGVVLNRYGLAVGDSMLLYRDIFKGQAGQPFTTYEQNGALVYCTSPPSVPNACSLGA